MIGVSVANIICSLLFGHRYDHKDPEFETLLNSIEGIFQGFVGDTNMKDIPILRLTPAFRKAMKYLHKHGDVLKAFYHKKIEEAKQRVLADEDVNDFTALYIKEVRKLEGKDKETPKIQEDWLIQLVSDFFLAGSETTATTMKWAVLYMAAHPDVQKKVQEELDNVFEKSPRRFCLSDRDKIPYTDATISEVQRMSAITAVGLPHEAIRDVEIKGYRIPKGTTVSTYF